MIPKHSYVHIRIYRRIYTVSLFSKIIIKRKIRNKNPKYLNIDIKKNPSVLNE